MKGTVLNLIAVVFNQGSTVIANIIVARLLLKEVFGEYAMVQNTLLTVVTLSQLAMGYTASKYIAEFRTSDPARAGRIMGVCAIVAMTMAIIGAILLIGLAPWLANTMLQAPHLTFPLMVGSGFLIFSTINGYQMGVLSGLEAFGSLAKSGIVSGIAALVSVYLGALWGGLDGAVVGLGISALIRCGVHNRWLAVECVKHNIKPVYRGSLKQEKVAILNFALPAAISGLYSMPMIWLATSFLVRSPGGYGEMALYSAANSLRLLVLFLPNVLSSVGLSILNNEKGNENVSLYYRVLKTNVIYISVVTLLGVLVMGGFGKHILSLFGNDFKAGDTILWLLLISTLFEAISIGLFHYIHSKAKIWLAFFTISVPRDALYVVFAYFLIQSYASVGLASAYLIASIIGLVLHFALFRIIYKADQKQGKVFHMPASQGNGISESMIQSK